MDVEQIEVKPERFSTGQWLRWGEYGLALAIIPGILLSILTGQFAFVASPLTLSLWLNLFRRQLGDRNTLRILQSEQQGLMYRYEVVLESTKRERSALLIDHAANLDERDHPQLMNVLDFRLQCIEKNRDSLQTYLDESCETVETAIREIQGWQDEHVHLLEQWTQNLESEVLPESTRDDVCDQLQSVAERVESLETLHSQILFAEFEARIRTVEQFIESMESQSSLLDNPDIQTLWSVIERPLVNRLEELQWITTSSHDPNSENGQGAPQSSQAVLDGMHVALAEQLNEWEVLHQDQGYKLQRLTDRLSTLNQNLEQIYQVVHENSMEFENTLVQSQFAHIDLSEIDVETMQVQLAELHVQLEGPMSSEVDISLASMLNHFNETVAEQIDRISQMMTSAISFHDDQLNMLLTPLLQHLTDCDEKLSRISAAQSSQDIVETLLGIEFRLNSLLSHLDTFDQTTADDLALYHDRHVQLSMLRYRAEELKSQVGIELGQIPYVIENYLRQRYPISDS